jgi:uncharacterized protein
VIGAHAVRVWAKEEPFPGAELADVTVGADRLSATGIAIGTNPLAYRLEYELSTDEAFATARLWVRTEGKDWSRVLDLRRAGSGAWACETESKGETDLPEPGGNLESVAGALDCDLGLSPLTNSMPILRHRLHDGGGPIDFLMAWVSVPDLAVHPSRQRYTFLRREPAARVVRYESRGGDFMSDLRVDDDGLVIDYPKLARRIG